MTADKASRDVGLQVVRNLFKVAMALGLGASAYFLANLKPAKTTIADCAEELEIFHHRCELQQYDLAYKILDEP